MRGIMHRKGEQHTSTSNRKLVLCGFFYDTVSISHYTASNDTISDKMQKVFKQFSPQQMELLSCQLPAELRITTKKTSVQAQIRTGYLHNKV
jgi:hypothetical protein